MVSKRQLLNRIEQLEEIVLQVTRPIIEHKRYNPFTYLGHDIMAEVTLKGEVEAIKEHLNIAVKYIPATSTKAKAKAFSNVPTKSTKKGKK
jgi:hypothetical protein